MKERNKILEREKEILDNQDIRMSILDDRCYKCNKIINWFEISYIDEKNRRLCEDCYSKLLDANPEMCSKYVRED